MVENKKQQDEKMTLEKLALMVGRGFNAVDSRLDKMDGRLDSVEAGIAVLTVEVRDVKARLDKIEEKIAELAGTLDAFLKRLIAHEEEFAIMKREMTVIKQVLKEKLNVDVDMLK